jgi:hypothetical protein
MFMYESENRALDSSERTKTKTAKKLRFLRRVSALVKFPAGARGFYILHNVEAGSEAPQPPLQ